MLGATTSRALAALAHLLALHALGAAPGRVAGGARRGARRAHAVLGGVQRLLGGVGGQALGAASGRLSVAGLAGRSVGAGGLASHALAGDQRIGQGGGAAGLIALERGALGAPAMRGGDGG